MNGSPSETGSDRATQAAVNAGDSSRLPPAMQAAVDHYGWELSHTLGGLGATGRDVTDADGNADPVDVMGDFADK